MKRFVMTIALTCVLAIPASAGLIPTVGAPQPVPPAGIGQATSENSPGDIPCDFAGQISEAGLSGFLAVLGLVI